MVGLETTNVILGVIAAVNVLYALVLIAAGIMGYRVYKQVMETIRELEQRHVAPVMQTVNAILADVQGVTAQVRAETERVDQAIHSAIDRVDETADRVRNRVGDKARRVVGIVRGIRDAIEAMLMGRERHRPEAHASGQL
jgi:hypothetical protein